MELYSSFIFGDIAVQYWKEPINGQVGLTLIPSTLVEQVSSEKIYAIDPLVQIKLIGDDYSGGFAQGITMRNSASVSHFRMKQQVVLSNEAGDQFVVSRFGHEHILGLELEHKLSFFKGCAALESQTVMMNDSRESVQLEMISSFSIGGITPFDQGDAPHTLLMHRMRSKWSTEGRLESRTIEELQLEPSWSKHGVNSERFGQAGSMPVRGFFPFVAIEDKTRQVIWAAQLAHPASWQMEVYRRDNALCLSGGLADREFGHWVKRLEPKERFSTPSAYLTVAEGDIDNVSQRLTQLQARALTGLPEREEKLPIVFNEFCTTWGEPSHDNLVRIARQLEGLPIEYFVIDAGWYAAKGKGWVGNVGDWVISPELFPSGLEATVNEIKKCGMIPGIWFELETCGPLADAYHWKEHLLQRDGIPITSGQRRFWNFRDPFVIDYLSEKVIQFLKRYDFGYLKIDYNETIGIGCDGAESLGEGLRLHLEAVQDFIKRIKRELPHLVIENCSSGGHRLEPSMMGITSMASFSDAHEELEIPIIAANMHRVILPRQSQIWAVLRKDDTIARLRYSIANTFLGRMCLSGDVCDLNVEQWRVVEEGISFYQRIADLIKEGISYRYGTPIDSYRSPLGWQCMVRMNDEATKGVAIFHTFGGALPERVDIELPATAPFHIESIYSDSNGDVEMKHGMLSFRVRGNFTATAVWLKSS
ncbi:glycoside hydrolase family 36 protein [Paenibacillus kobensis]|uniref:glycoside hydrolase family 36 protein n=1 Tax=Paenibacillus kobensis TaxID=59841 RepID=UPI000FDAD3E0|nr:alpha-galactosidase [Paenibacillus kobensis]